MTKFRMTVSRKDLYECNNNYNIDADRKLDVGTLELRTLIQLFLEMLNDMK